MYQTARCVKNTNRASCKVAGKLQQVENPWEMLGMDLQAPFSKSLKLNHNIRLEDKGEDHKVVHITT